MGKDGTRCRLRVLAELYAIGDIGAGVVSRPIEAVRNTRACVAQGIVEECIVTVESINETKSENNHV